MSHDHDSQTADRPMHNELVLPLGTKLLHTVFYVLGNYFR